MRFGITPWLEWYLTCLHRSIESAHQTLNQIFLKAKYWDFIDNIKQISLNERQRKILNLMLDGDFFGHLTTSKWAKICKCSQDTAQRDITDLMRKRILEKNAAGGRSTSYILLNIVEL